MAVDLKHHKIHQKVLIKISKWMTILYHLKVTFLMTEKLFNLMADHSPKVNAHLI